MANPEKMMFPVGFDLEGGIIEAQKEWPALQKRLQKTLDGKPLTIKVTAKTTEQFETFSGKMKTSINDIRKNLASLEKQWNSMDKNQKFDKDGNLTKEAQEIVRKYNEMKVALDSYGQSLSQISNKIKKSANDEIKAQQKKEKAIRKTNSAYKAQSSYISRLIQRLGIYTSIYAAAGMLRDIRETTAEFELQEVALGAIIQDAHEASVLFSQIKAAAVESPYQIKELVNYTKQLAAYGFEQKSLFDTTMKLADISAGLGADMSRIILAVGQVSAATVLKGTELRQFTELGIPMVELLAKKFTQLRGEVVTTGEVFEMISDKAVSFKMVEEILNDLTSAGGMFYDMQRKQAETLAGQWSNLKDSIAIAYDEIGNTAVVRSAMEGWITAVKTLVEEWRFFAGILGRVAVSMAAVKVVSFFLPTQITNTKMLAQATNQLAAAQERYNVAQGKGLAGQSAKWAMNHAKWMIKAANATTLFGRGMKQIAAFFAGGGWLSLLITGLTVAVSWFITARKEANRLNEELSKIGSEGSVKMEQSVRNFERLAKIAVDSVDGTKQQTEALKELQRTYGDIIPAQDLSIEKLRQMKGSYEAVTQAIREKIAMQTLEQKISTIQEDYGSDIAKQQKKFKEYLEETAGLSSEEAIRVIANIQRQIADGAVTGVIDGLDALDKALGEEVLDPIPYDVWTDIYDGFGMIQKPFKKFINLSVGMENAIKSVTSEMESETGVLGKYTDAWKKANSDLATDIGNITVSKNTKLYEEEVEKAKVEKYVDFLGQTIGSEIEGFDMSEYIDGNEIDFSSLFNLEGLSVQAKNAVRQVQTALQGLDGWKETLQSFAKDVTIDGITRKMSLYTDEEIGNMGNLKDTLEDVAKKWKEFDAAVTRYGKTLKGKINPEEEKQLKNKKAQAEEYKRQAYAILEYYNSLDLIQEKGKGKGQDEWIILMKNRASFMKDFQQGVEDLSKKMKEQSALLKEQGIMANRGISVGYDVSTLKGTADELSKWYEDAIKEVEKKIKSAGANEGFAELSISAILKKDTKNQLIKSYQDLLQWLFNQKTDFETKQLEEDLKKEIDRLAKAVARSKEAKDFYDKMLGMTGDRQLSADLTMSVYGGVGDDLKENIRKQLENAFEGVDIRSAFDGDNVNWAKLNDLVESIPIESKREEARKLVKEGIKDNSKLIQSYVKLLMEYDDVQQKRVNIANKTAKDIATIEEGLRLEIEGINKNPDIQNKGESIREATDRADKAIVAIKAREKYELSKLSGDYIRFFSAINSMSSDTANTIRTELRREVFEAFSKGAISAEELRKELKAIDTQFNKLNENSSFFAAYMNDGFDGFISKVRESGDELDALAAKMKGLGSVDDLSSDEQSFINKMLNIFGGKGQKSLSDLAKSFNGDMSKMGEAVAQVGGKMQAMFSNASKAIATVDTIIKAVHQSIMATQQVIDQINSMRNEDNQIGGWFKYISDFSQYAFSGWEKLKSGDVAGATADVIGSIISIFQNIQADKIKKLNEDIEDQEDLLKELEYQYRKLEKAAESTFGTEYIDNYQQRLERLYAMQAAYEAQAQAERDKGKKADEQKAKDYEKSAREAADSIADAQYELSEHFLGTDVASAARDFAKAWIDAYKEFGSTTDAMKEKFSEMVENMVVESLAAKVIQGHMQDIFDTVESLSKDGQLSVSDAAHIAELSKLATENIDVGMTNLMNALEAAGISVRGMGSDLTGISKDIATASEESILGLAAGINTQNFYISQVPPKLDTIIAILQGGASPIGGINVQDLITIQNQHLAYLPNIATNTLNTADRCERAALACESALSKISSVISLRGTTSSHVVNTN